MQVLGALSDGTAVGPWAGAHGGEPKGPRGERWLQHAIKDKKARLDGRIVEPVLVAWDGLLPPLGARPAAAGQREKPQQGSSGTGRKFAKLVLSLEGGGTESWETRGEESRTAWREPASGRSLGSRIPLGYHRLLVETGSGAAETTVISAPLRCWHAEESRARWGVFTPLYALRSERNWGAGDLADMEKLLGVVSAAGGSAVATLPLLAGYLLDRPFEPAPYTPVSRLFWNEFYLAVEHTAEWPRCAAARTVWYSGETQERVARCRTAQSVDYAEVMALKRRVLEELCRCFFMDGGSERKEAFTAYLRARPDALGFAAFRARVEALGGDWREWPGEEQAHGSGPVEPEQLPEAGRYHLYCQWQMEEQLSRLSGSGASVAGGNASRAAAMPEAGSDMQAARGEPGHALRAPAGLFLDLPVGVHAGGFDTWRWRSLFVGGISSGAPPDSFFVRGQYWDSPPLHPERIREEGHSYYVRCLRHHMRHAGHLRIDHVMSLHRLFWVPEGREPSEGVYVTYPAEELYAALCLESNRHRTVVVGEDLGTVPAGVRVSMRRHAVLGTWMLQSAAKPRAAQALGPVPRRVVAGLGTHDMFPFAGFLSGDDIRARVETGQLAREAARRVFAARRRLVTRLSVLLAVRPPSEGPAELLHGALAHLGASQAVFVLINLADLLLETKPQNMPGTGSDRDNWRRKLTGAETEIERAIAEAARGLRTG